MKKIYLLVILTIATLSLFSQKIEDNNHFNVEDTVYMPHYGQNEVIDSILSITMGNNNTLKSTNVDIIEDGTPFHIPVKIWVYHNDGGIGDHNALSISQAERLFNEVNQHYENNNTGIQFYLKCEIQHVSSTKYNTIDSEDEYTEMITTYHEPRALNWHLIRNTTTDWAGKARFPWDNHNFRFATMYGGWLSNNEILTTVHEIGHTLGLLHTHENTRGSGYYNGDAGDCYQESVSRSREQGVFCVSTMGKTKCDINGDALCGTEAAPNDGGGPAGVNVGNELMDLDNRIDCNYVGGGTDNWDDTWTPPTNNYMSYLEYRACRNSFEDDQTGVMQMYILLYMADGGWPLPGIGGTPWYNLHALSLSGTVYSDENETFYSPQIIEAASQNNTYTVKSGATVELRAREKITLHPGFHAESGSNFSASVGDINNCGLVYSNSTILKSSSPIISSYGIEKNKINKCTKILLKALNREYQTNINYTKDDESNNINSDRNYKVYPNPFKEKVNFVFYLDRSGQVVIKICSIDGNEIIHSSNYYKAGYHSITKKLSDLHKGVYIYRIYLNNNKIYSGKLIK
jgi:hypothetical protein